MTRLFRSKSCGLVGITEFDSAPTPPTPFRCLRRRRSLCTRRLRFFFLFVVVVDVFSPSSQGRPTVEEREERRTLGFVLLRDEESRAKSAPTWICLYESNPEIKITNFAASS
ncbi:hypothetical protein LINPERHAP2_LOCUS31431 [Linum perenne]